MKVHASSDWHRFARCGSTNDEAQRLARAGAEAGSVVVAAEQTQGRGRLGRVWHSPRQDNLYLSVILRPPLSPQRAPLLCLCAGLALHRAASTLLDEALATSAHAANSGDASGRPRLRLKWPNDLLGQPAQSPAAPFRKLGGILTELVCAGANIDFVVVGVGCNVSGRDFPAEVPATSLQLLTGGFKDPVLPNARASSPASATASPTDRLGTLFLQSLADFYDQYLTRGVAPIRQAFTVAAELGPHHPRVIVKTAQGETLSGVPLELGLEGELMLRLDSGSVAKILAGDVDLAPSVKIAS